MDISAILALFASTLHICTYTSQRSNECTHTAMYCVLCTLCYTERNVCTVLCCRCMYVAHYACAAGDTWASEVGVLAAPRPRLVTSLFLRAVPPGTNGGMSLLGTAASAAGGLFVGLLFCLLALLIDSPAPASQLPMALLGLVCGLLGSLLDSLLGATLQASYYSHRTRKVVRGPDPGDPSIEHLCGIDVLSNEAVNAVSIALTMLAATVLGPRIFCLCDPEMHC